MTLSFTAFGSTLPTLTAAEFYADPPFNRIEIRVRVINTIIAAPPDAIAIPLKDHLATFRRAQMGPDEYVYQLLSKPPKGWTWVIHGGKMFAYRTAILRGGKK